MKTHDDAKSGVIVRQLDRRAVQVDYGLHERHAETAARRSPACLQPIEAAEYFFALWNGDARTGVGDAQYRRTCFLRQPHGDLHPGRTVADRVFDEVGDHLRQKLAVAAD